MEIVEILSIITLDFLKGLVLGIGLGAIVGFFVLRYLGALHKDTLELILKDKESHIKDREAIIKEKETLIKEKEALRQHYEAEFKRIKEQHETLEKNFKDALIGMKTGFKDLF